MSGGILFGNSNGGGGGSSGLVTAGNGLTAVGTEVIAGGALTQDTTINTGAFNFLAGDPTHLNSALRIGQGYTQFLTENGTYKLSILNENISGGQMWFIATLGGQDFGINLNTGFFKIIDGINNFGMQYGADFSANGKLNPRWIPDYAAVQALVGAGGFVATNKVTGVMASETLLTYTHAAGTDHCYQISVAALYRTGTGSLSVNVSYTDDNSGTQVFVVFTLNTAEPANNPPIIINAKDGAAIAIAVVITGTVVADFQTGIQLLF